MCCVSILMCCVRDPSLSREEGACSVISNDEEACSVSVCRRWVAPYQLALDMKSQAVIRRHVRASGILKGFTLTKLWHGHPSFPKLEPSSQGVPLKTVEIEMHTYTSHLHWEMGK
jgi:hypothetical protein